MDVIIWIAYIIYGVVESTLDGWKSKKGGIIDHSALNWSVIFRLGSAIGVSFIFAFTSPVFHVAYVLMLLLSFWIVFDINFNFVKNGLTGYIGKTAITDKIVRWLGIVDGNLYSMLKMIPLGAIFISYHNAAPLALAITLGVIVFTLLSIYIMYLIKTKNGDSSKGKI